jgi:hypothetical protein
MGLPAVSIAVDAQGRIERAAREVLNSQVTA